MQMTSTRYLLSDGYLYVGSQRKILGYTLLSNTNFNYIGGFRDKNGNGHYLFELTNVLPRIAFYPDYVSLNNPEKILKTIVSPDFDEQHLVVVQGIEPDKHISEQAYKKVEVLKHKPWLLKIRVNASEDGILLRNMRYHPDWHVYVDGNRAKLLKANYLMQAVFVKEGVHTVEFRWEPPAFAAKTSVWLVILALLAMGVLAVAYLTGQKNTAEK